MQKFEENFMAFISRTKDLNFSDDNLNFEDPEDMLSKQEMLAEEIQKRAQQVQTESVEGSPRSARTDQSAPKIE